MSEYKMKPIDKKLIDELKNSMIAYRTHMSTANSFQDIKDYLYELSNAFSEVVDARSKAIDNSIPQSELKRIMFFTDYKVTILSDKELEDLLTDASHALGEDRNWSK